MTAAGLRSGAARTAVVELLARDAHCLLSATEITDKLRAQHTGSAASVYRVIEELFELGLVHRLDGRTLRDRRPRPPSPPLHRRTDRHRRRDAVD